ncbi:hypothetical protein K6W80_15125, partial [Burkholderia contaminans]|uniref:hypothetical protein n=1 Tax=Burkholderia contaminans TaxID=488447 RepID=UPI001C975D10
LRDCGRTVPRQVFANGLAEPTAAAGHQRDAAGERRSGGFVFDVVHLHLLAIVRTHPDWL